MFGDPKPRSLDEIRQLLARVEMRNSPLKWLPPQVWHDSGGVIISISHMMPHRDNGKMVEIRQDIPFSYAQIRHDGYILHQYREAMLDMFVHEFHESYHLDGVRVFDPHKDD